VTLMNTTTPAQDLLEGDTIKVGGDTLTVEKIKIVKERGDWLVRLTTAETGVEWFDYDYDVRTA